MTSVLFTIFSGIFGAAFNATAFSGTYFFFSKLTDHGEKERKRSDLTLEKLQSARDKWNKDRMKRLDFINKTLREKNEARAYINNVDEAILEYYRVFAKQIRLRPPEPQLSDFYHLSEGQKNGELLFVTEGTGLATYAVYKPWLAKQALWQLYIPPPREINHPHYDVTRPNEQHQFDLLYVPHNIFEGNTYIYILSTY